MKQYCLHVFFFIVSVVCSLEVTSLEYGRFATSKKGVPISKFFVIGERCSGTNFLDALIKTNTQLIKEPLGDKHFPPWYQLGPEYYLGDSRYYNFADTDEWLILIIFRNPYDWLRSFYLEPWHVRKSMKKLSFPDFIRSKWELDLKDQFLRIEVPRHLLLDKNPVNGLPFENILALRTAKINDMLEIKNRASNVYYINYETVRDHPKEVLAEISSLYEVALLPKYAPVTTYKGNTKKKFVKKKYGEIDERDRAFINANLDRVLEEQIGYHLVD